MNMQNFKHLRQLMLGFCAFQALVAACKLRLFQILAEQPGAERAQLAQRLGISEHGARVLLLACCTYGLLHRREGRYFNSEMADEFLTDASIFPIDGFTSYCDVVQYKAFQYLTDSLLADRNLGLQTVPGTGEGLYKRLAESPELEACFQRGMAPRDRSSRDLLFDSPELASVRRLLDVGGGPGFISGCLAQDHPDLAVTLFDLPTVCEKAEAHFREIGSTQLTTHPGDFIADPFPTGQDGVLFSHVLEIFSEEKILGLLRKAYASLPAGGRVFIYGMACDDEESGGEFATWGSLYFYVLASGEGMMYPVADYRRWLSDVGFTSIVERQNEFENMVLIATK